ncbi:MAG: polysaccharide biosynthesis tyrosine autokinase [Muribaculaceae bacterium]|nr:polysaccharide biosynthesis tyrosine autokinase [Muribaculaceae bacterium]
MTENVTEQNESKIDFSSIIALVKRKWWMFAISLFLCLLLAGLYLYVKHSVYSIHATVLVAYDSESGSMGNTLMSQLALGGVGGASVEDEVLVMNSHSIKTDMIKELELNRSYSTREGLRNHYYYNDSPVKVLAPEAVFDTLGTGLKFNIDIKKGLSHIKVKVKEGWFKTVGEGESNRLPMVVNTIYGPFSIDTTKYYVPDEDITIKAIVAGNSYLAEVYGEDITVAKTEKKANGISLFIEDGIVERGEDILNKMIELYNRRGRAEKDEMALNTAKFIEERLGHIYNELSESEQNIESYKKNNDITDLQSEAAFQMQKKGQLEQQLLTAETNFQILKMTRDFISDPANKYSLIPTNSEVGAASAAIASYNSMVLGRMYALNDASSDSRNIKLQEQQIDAVRDNIILTLNKSYENARVALNDLRHEAGYTSSKLNQVPTQERQFRELSRQQAIKNNLYSFLLQKREENQLVLAATTPKGKIVDAAYAHNKPIAPKKAQIIFIALFMGLFLPALWLYVKSLFNNKFDSTEALSHATKLPVLGEICHSRSAAKRAIVVEENSTRPIVELFRLLRSNLQFLLYGEGCKTIMITSGISGEGKSFISINLAESLALLGKKVVLIGADIRAPKLAEYLNIASSPGLTNYLSGQTEEVADVLQQTGGAADVIVAGPIPPNPSELLLGGRLEALINGLSSSYDYIIIDSAPIALVSDTFSISKFADATIYVARTKVTTRALIKYLNTVVDRKQLSNVSIVLNDTDPKLSYGYGYGYGASDEDDEK